SQGDAERRLDAEMARVESELQRKANARSHFVDAAKRYLEESRDKRAVGVAPLGFPLWRSTHAAVASSVRCGIGATSTSRRMCLSDQPIAVLRAADESRSGDRKTLRALRTGANSGTAAWASVTLPPRRRRRLQSR